MHDILTSLPKILAWNGGGSSNMSEILNQKHMASKATSQVEDFIGTELKNIQHYFEELK